MNPVFQQHANVTLSFKMHRNNFKKWCNFVDFDLI